MGVLTSEMERIPKKVRPRREEVARLLSLSATVEVFT
jgi:hypothetical protein